MERKTKTLHMFCIYLKLFLALYYLLFLLLRSVKIEMLFEHQMSAERHTFCSAVYK